MQMNQALGSKWSEERIGHLHCPPRLSHSYQNTISGYLWFRTNLHQWAGIQFGSCLDQSIQRKHYLTVQQCTVSEQKETRRLSCFCMRICIEFVQHKTKHGPDPNSLWQTGTSYPDSNTTPGKASIAMKK